MSMNLLETHLAKHSRYLVPYLFIKSMRSEQDLEPSKSLVRNQELRSTSPVKRPFSHERNSRLLFEDPRWLVRDSHRSSNHHAEQSKPGGNGRLVSLVVLHRRSDGQEKVPPAVKTFPIEAQTEPRHPWPFPTTVEVIASRLALSIPLCSPLSHVLAGCKFRRNASFVVPYWSRKDKCSKFLEFLSSLCFILAGQSDVEWAITNNCIKNWCPLS